MSRGGERGSALLEVVLALSITAMLAAALTQAAGFGLDTLDRASTSGRDSAAALSQRRMLADLLARIDPAGPDAPSFAAGPDRMQWRGVAPDADGGWRAGKWRLEAAPAALVFSRCDDIGPGAACVEEARFTPVDRFAYADARGVFAPEWPAGGPPTLIRITGESAALTVQPRVMGDVR